MELPKAINRLTWRFSKNASFKPSPTDIEAFNAVLGWVNHQQSKVVQNNQLFAKLYIYFLNKKIEEFGSTVFYSIPEKELSALLDTPLDLFFVAFHQSMHHNIRKNVFEKNGVELNLRSVKSQVQINSERLNLANMSKDDIKKIFEETYDLETVSGELVSMCNEALKRFS